MIKTLLFLLLLLLLPLMISGAMIYIYTRQRQSVLNFSKKTTWIIRLLSTLSVFDDPLFLSLNLGLLSCATVCIFYYEYTSNLGYSDNPNFPVFFYALLTVVGSVASSVGFYVGVFEIPKATTRSFVMKYGGLLLSTIGFVNFIIWVVVLTTMSFFTFFFWGFPNGG